MFLSDVKARHDRTASLAVVFLPRTVSRDGFGRNRTELQGAGGDFPSRVARRIIHAIPARNSRFARIAFGGHAAAAAAELVSWQKTGNRATRGNPKHQIPIHKQAPMSQ